MNFSFLGVGNMGEPLAMNLLKAGEELRVYTRREDCAGRFRAAGATVVGAPADLADCDVLCTCLPQPDQILAAVMGDSGLYRRMPPGAIHLEFSTIEPATAHRMADAAGACGVEYIQATVSKTPAIAAEGHAPLFLGGSAKAIEKLWPVLKKIAIPYDLKTVDAACAVKLVSNLIGMTNVALVAEGLRIGQAAGVDGEKLLELLLDTGCASFQMKTRGPWMLEEDYKARFSIDIAAKDLRLGCAMARELGYEPKLMEQGLKYLEEGHARGIGEEDVCALYKLMGRK
ncbi:MAG: NAD(P)-dependent oxidoreductase [Desulfovibrio sp.]|nr:NAD(P)-dependent oxidoreductase [Desulfovibrio sp.]